MANRKKKKINKTRGRRGSGYGFTKGHRKSGQRGGKGAAGSKKHHYQKVMAEDPHYFGKHGFTRPQRVVEDVSVLNVRDIDMRADQLVEDGLGEKKGKRYEIDVSKMGIDKVLGAGRVTRKLDLRGIEDISDSAKRKITEKGGTIDLIED